MVSPDCGEALFVAAAKWRNACQESSTYDAGSGEWFAEPEF
jgi:hypothetical protein